MSDLQEDYGEKTDSSDSRSRSRSRSRSVPSQIESGDSNQRTESGAEKKKERKRLSKKRRERSRRAGSGATISEVMSTCVTNALSNTFTHGDANAVDNAARFSRHLMTDGNPVSSGAATREVTRERGHRVGRPKESLKKRLFGEARTMGLFADIQELRSRAPRYVVNFYDRGDKFVGSGDEATHQDRKKAFGRAVSSGLQFLKSYGANKA